MRNWKKPNGTPACAGVTDFFESSILNINNRHARAGGHPVFLFSFTLFLLLTACGERPVAFTPVAVDMPVPVACHAPLIPAPPVLMAALPKTAPLADGMKACLQDDVLEHAYAEQLAAALAACRMPTP